MNIWYASVICFALATAAACGMSQTCSEHFPVLMVLCGSVITGAYGNMQVQRNHRAGDHADDRDRGTDGRR